VARLEEVMELNNVAVASRDLLENLDLIAGLDDQCGRLSLAQANTNHVLAALPISFLSLQFQAYGKELLVEDLARIVLASLNNQHLHFASSLLPPWQSAKTEGGQGDLSVILGSAHPNH
jgi:hypothetical protein